MRYPQLLIYESDGRIARALRPLAEEHHWSLREPRRPEECLGLLRRGGPAILVLKLGPNPVPELSLLERVTWLLPETATVVVGDVHRADLARLCWDLGATYVLFPPQPRERFLEVLVSLLTRSPRNPSNPHEGTSPPG